MVNVDVVVWLLIGGVIGWLSVQQGAAGTVALLGSSAGVAVLLAVFSLVRRQPVR